MKIVFDNIVFSLQRVGGISVVWQELLSRWIKTGKDNLFFIEHPTNIHNILRQKLDLSSGTIISPTRRLLALDRYINPKINSDEPFIFHSSYFRICPSKNAINITTVHDFTYDYFYKGKRRLAFLHLHQRNKAIKKSDAIICISKNTKNDLLKFIPDIDEKKIYVIYNGVSDEYKIIEDKDISLKDYILFVGARTAYKNGPWFAQALRNTDYKVLFCGKPMTEQEQLYYDEVLGTDRYKVLSGLSNKELNRIYNSVKCLVYPSSYEGFGIPVLEAQRAGCPVIALEISSIPEIIGNTPLLMKSLNKEELLNKILSLEDSKTRDEIIVNGLENSKRFTWDRAFKQYYEVYKKILKEKSEHLSLK